VAGRGGRCGDFADAALLLFFRALLLNGTARQAVLSVVAGRTLMADGEIDGVDLGYWRRRGQELFDKMKAAYTLRDGSRRTTAGLFPPVYARVEH
jgi:8-oxoguanine deaminase